MAGLRATKASRSGAGWAVGFIPSVSEAREGRAVTQPALLWGGSLGARVACRAEQQALGDSPGPTPPLPQPPLPPCRCWPLSGNIRAGGKPSCGGGAGVGAATAIVTFRFSELT